MSEDRELLHLMAKVVIGFAAIADVYAPYNAWGINVGQCRFCGVVGEMQYPDIFYDHKPGCTMMLAKQLVLTLTEREKSESSAGPAKDPK